MFHPSSKKLTNTLPLPTPQFPSFIFLYTPPLHEASADATAPKPTLRALLPQSSSQPLMLVPEVPKLELSLFKLQGGSRKPAGHSWSMLILLQVIQANNKILRKNSISQKAVSFHQSQYLGYFRIICHSSGPVINSSSCKYIPLELRTVSCGYLRKLLNTSVE